MSDSTQNGLTTSTKPITSTTPGEVIQNLYLDVTGDQPAINITSDNVTIKNVHIKTTTGDGIDVFGDNATISNVEVDATTPTDNGGMDGEGSDGVYAYGVSGLKVDHATFRNTGSGVATGQSPGTVLSNIEGYNMQGPFPGGQLVQFGESDGSSLTNFYVDNDPKISHPEDDISVYNSRNVTISRGVLDGDNSPSGVGVMVEGTSDGTKVGSVDAVHMGDGAFSSYSNNVSFTDVRSFNNIATDQGRGKPLSGGLIFYAPGSGISFSRASYTNPGQPGNIVSGNPVTKDISENKTATPMGHISNAFPWTVAPVTPVVPVTPTAPVTPVIVTPPKAPVSPVAPVHMTTATAPGQTLTSTANDKFDAHGQADTTFVFKPGFGQDIVQNFVTGGDAHDILSLPSADFASIAAVLRNTHTLDGSAVITDPTTHDTIKLVGVSKHDLKANPGDLTLHG